MVEKTSYMVLGLIALISIVGFFMMFKAVPTANVPLMTSKVYGGAIKGVEMPYYEDRVVLVNKGNSIDVIDTSTVQNRIPTQSALENREPQRAYSLLDSCEGMIIQDQLPAGYIYEASWNDAVARYGMHNCKDMTAWISQWCCKRD
ncbi:hypothetical protein JW851_04070 [Candidatus Woesearchaeota archaeon]|nr:hypothetical protein [Candidatus Woesearchaeota archaeon]